MHVAGALLVALGHTVEIDWPAALDHLWSETSAAFVVTSDAVRPPVIHDHDLLVTPSTFLPAWPLGGNPGSRETGTLLAPFSLTGQPALSLPLHHTDDGLPVGVQLVGRSGADEMLLRLAQDIQAAADWTTRRPPLV